MYNKITSGRIKAGILFSIIFFLSVSNNIYGYSDKFELGMFSYEHGDYSKAITVFTEIISIKETEREEKLKSLELLGIINNIKGNIEKSREYFNLLLNEDSNYSLDPLFVPPEIVVFFNSIKNKRRTLLKPLSTGEEQEKEIQPHKFITKVFNFTPFGVGYYIKKRKNEGLIFSVAETLLLSVNVGLYYYRNCGLKGCKNKFYEPDVAKEAQTLQTVQLVSGYLFLGIWGYNIIDLNIKF